MTGHDTRKQMSIPELTPFEAANEIIYQFISTAEDIHHHHHHHSLDPSGGT